MLHVDVRRRLGAFQLDVSFSVDAHAILAVHGPSGSGKTTLINLLAGLDRPDSGRIVVDGRVLFDSKSGVDVKPEKRRVGYVFQDCRLFPHMTVASNLRYGRRRGERDIDFEQVVSLLDLQALLRRRPRFLSGGEKQRVAIGRALLSSPRILLMDEPLASIDPGRKSEILPFVRLLRDAFALPIVYVSHAADEIAQVAERAIRIENGRIAAADPVRSSADQAYTETGMRLIAVIEAHDSVSGLSVLGSPLGQLYVPRRFEPPGTVLQVTLGASAVEPVAEVVSGAISVLPARMITGTRT